MRGGADRRVVGGRLFSGLVLSEPIFELHDGGTEVVSEGDEEVEYLTRWA